MLYILKQLPIEYAESKQTLCDYKIIGKCIRLYCKSLYLTKIKTTTNQLSFSTFLFKSILESKEDVNEEDNEIFLALFLEQHFEPGK